MPSSISHAVAGLAVGAWVGPKEPPQRFWTLAAICGALPDIDVLGWFSVPNSSLIGHRALTHSISFAVLIGALATWSMFRDYQEWTARLRLFAAFTLATASHGVLDAFSAYSVGVEFFAPFSQTRYRFLFNPLRDYQEVGVWRALLEEFFWVLLPAAGLTLAGWVLRRSPRSAQRTTA